MEQQVLPMLDTKTQATLLSDKKKTAYCPRAELISVPTPSRTDTWIPVPHHMLVDTIEMELSKHDIWITREEYAVSHDGAKLFGTLDLRQPAEGGNDETSFALGVRTSNDKSMSIQIAVGARVFVCDNMVFSGDLIALNRRHTSGLKLQASVADGIGRYIEDTEKLSKNIDRLKGKMLLQPDAENMIFRAFDQEVLPTRLFHPVVKSYREVRNHGHISQWQLHNCFTLHAHQLQPARKFRATADIGSLFGI